MSSTTALVIPEGEQRYSVSLAPHTGFSLPTGTWNPSAAFPILIDWLPAGTPALRVQPPAATAPEPVITPKPLHPLRNIEGEGWLKVAESAFAFWDNPDDDGWDSL